MTSEDFVRVIYVIGWIICIICVLTHGKQGTKSVGKDVGAAAAAALWPVVALVNVARAFWREAD